MSAVSKESKKKKNRKGHHHAVIEPRRTTGFEDRPCLASANVQISPEPDYYSPPVHSLRLTPEPSGTSTEVLLHGETRQAAKRRDWVLKSYTAPSALQVVGCGPSATDYRVRFLSLCPPGDGSSPLGVWRTLLDPLREEERLEKKRRSHSEEALADEMRGTSREISVREKRSGKKKKNDCP